MICGDMHSRAGLEKVSGCSNRLMATTTCSKAPSLPPYLVKAEHLLALLMWRLLLVACAASNKLVLMLSRRLLLLSLMLLSLLVLAGKVYRSAAGGAAAAAAAAAAGAAAATTTTQTRVANRHCGRRAADTQHMHVCSTTTPHAQHTCVCSKQHAAMAVQASAP
jgi:hypothetical protein